MEKPKIKEYMDAYVETLKTYPEYEAALFEQKLFEKLFKRAVSDMQFRPASHRMLQDYTDLAWKMWNYGANYEYTE